MSRIIQMIFRVLRRVVLVSRGFLPIRHDACNELVSL